MREVGPSLFRLNLPVFQQLALVSAEVCLRVSITWSNIGLPIARRLDNSGVSVRVCVSAQRDPHSADRIWNIETVNSAFTKQSLQFLGSSVK